MDGGSAPTERGYSGRRARREQPAKEFRGYKHVGRRTATPIGESGKTPLPWLQRKRQGSILSVDVAIVV